MARITINDSSFKKGMVKLEQSFPGFNSDALAEIANEVLRLSSLEVPLDTGNLMNSGHTEKSGDEYLVGYNTVYAARLHENPQYSFKNGRKGKYLESPIKNNLRVFREYYADSISKLFK